MDPVLVGRWRLVEMEVWDREALDLVEPAFLEIRADGTGLIGFIAISGTIDARSDGMGGLEFSWEGDDEGHPVSARGVGRLNGDGDLEGRIFFHVGVARNDDLSEDEALQLAVEEVNAVRRERRARR